METLTDAIKAQINRFSAENDSDTPDFILAQYLMSCLENFNRTLIDRERYYGRFPGSIKTPEPGFMHEDYAHNRNPQIGL